MVTLEEIMKQNIALIFLICLLALPCQAAGSDIESRMKTLEETLNKQQKIIEDQQKLIREMKEELRTFKELNETEPLKKAESLKAAEAPQQMSSGLTGLFGGSILTNPYISLVFNGFYYSSSISERELESRGIPGYSILGFEPKKGFNLESAELFLFAPVDPYFNLYATIPVTSEGAEVEEAYFVTSALPAGFQLKGGKFKSNFSRYNAQHPHAWDFANPPLSYRAFLGQEGLIETGLQLTYLPALPIYTLLGFEAFQGENEILFNPNAKNGPFAYTAYIKSSFDIGDASTFLLGPYAVWGKTRTETVAESTFLRGDSQLYGFEAIYKWKPTRKQSLSFMGEYMLRNQKGQLSDLSLASSESLKRAQDGFYVQGFYQYERWRFGARYDLLDLFKDTYRLAGVNQDFGEKPWRLTGAIEFNPSEFSRLRFQYEHDRSGRDGRTNHAFFIQLILGIGAHAAHPF
jgi:hypothetical protein